MNRRYCLLFHSLYLKTLIHTKTHFVCLSWSGLFSRAGVHNRQGEVCCSHQSNRNQSNTGLSWHDPILSCSSQGVPYMYCWVVREITCSLVFCSILPQRQYLWETLAKLRPGSAWRLIGIRVTVCLPSTYMLFTLILLFTVHSQCHLLTAPWLSMHACKLTSNSCPQQQATTRENWLFSMILVNAHFMLVLCTRDFILYFLQGRLYLLSYKETPLTWMSDLIRHPLHLLIHTLGSALRGMYNLLIDRRMNNPAVILLTFFRTVTVHNRTNVVVHYEWKMHSSGMEEEFQRQLWVFACHTSQVYSEKNTSSHRFTELLNDDEGSSREAFMATCLHNPSLRDRFPILLHSFQNKKKASWYHFTLPNIWHQKKSILDPSQQALTDDKFLYTNEAFSIDPVVS